MSTLDDFIPEPLATWNGEVLERLRAESKGEALFFEFKGDFRGEYVEKAVCAFSNALGGFLLLGVTADTENRIAAFPGLEAADDWPSRVSDNIVGHISPLPAWDTVVIDSPDDPTRRVVVTRVEPSVRTPHVVTKTGTIYVRVPNESQPIKDKASLDALVSRGRSGTDLAPYRARRILREASLLQLADLPEGRLCVVEIAAVPSPALADQTLSILTPDGKARSHEVFDASGLSLLANLRSFDLREDGVDYRNRLVVAGRRTDGSIYARLWWARTPVPAPTIRDLLDGMLAVSASQRPPVHQVFLLLQLSGVRGRALTTAEIGGSYALFKQDTWEWSGEVGTDIGSRGLVPAEIVRRLWRHLGSPQGLEPD
jgi:hypothetical protein